MQHRGGDRLLKRNPIEERSLAVPSPSIRHHRRLRLRPRCLGRVRLSLVDEVGDLGEAERGKGRW